MKKAPILTNDSTVLKLYVTNDRPHNMIFFDDNKFMKYVKDVLWNDYHIASIILDKKESVKTACGIGDYEYNDNITGVMYLMSVAVIDPYMELDDYYDEFRYRMLEVEL